MLSAPTHHFDLITKLKNKTARIGIIGLGYVGLPLAKGFATAGFSVTGIESSAGKIDLIKQGYDYIDPDSSDLATLLSKLNPTSDYAAISECQVLIICVPTPLTRNLEPDISNIERTSVEISKRINPGTLVVLESTTFPGTTKELVYPLIKAGGRVQEAGKDCFMAFSPERIDPGNPYYHTTNTVKVVGGMTEACSKLAFELYQQLLGGAEYVRLASCTRAAEMEKIFENVFRSVNIALVNEMAILCRQMGLDVWEIIELASSKPYGFMPFQPGPGIGGHCIPLDPFYLCWKAREFDFRTRFIELAGELNALMPRHVLELATEALKEKGLHQAKVLIVGAAYKANVSDSRESPAAKIIALLHKRGARVDIHDPLAQELRLRDGQVLKSVPLKTNAYDLTILVTIHSSMNVLELCTTAPNIVDTRGVTRGLDIPAQVTVLGSGKPS